VGAAELSVDRASDRILTDRADDALLFFATLETIKVCTASMRNFSTTEGGDQCPASPPARSLRTARRPLQRSAQGPGMARTIAPRNPLNQVGSQDDLRIITVVYFLDNCFHFPYLE
jgi:hypothetical protein